MIERGLEIACVGFMLLGVVAINTGAPDCGLALMMVGIYQKLALIDRRMP